MDSDQWFPWVRIIDIDTDGDLDIISDDIVFDVTYLNDGSASFSLN